MMIIDNHFSIKFTFFTFIYASPSLSGCMIDASSHLSHPKMRLFSQTFLGTFASLYLSFCTPLTPVVKSGIDTPTPMQTLPVQKLPPQQVLKEETKGESEDLQKKDIYSLFLKEQELLKESAASCSELSLGEKVSLAYREMQKEYLRWNQRDDCPEYYFQNNIPPWKIFMLTRQSYQESCVTSHAEEIAEDKLRILDGREPLKTYFLVPVSNGLEIGIGNYDHRNPKLSFAVFPDVYDKPEYYEQYALDVDTLKITLCNTVSSPAACSLLPVEKTLQSFCTAITTQKELEQRK